MRHSLQEDTVAKCSTPSLPSALWKAKRGCKNSPDAAAQLILDLPSTYPPEEIIAALAHMVVKGRMPDQKTLQELLARAAALRAKSKESS